jgi:hypothetical protein
MRELLHVECKEKNLPNETACKSYAYRKRIILKGILRNGIPGCG